MNSLYPSLLWLGVWAFSADLVEGDYIGVTWSEEHMTNLLVCPAPNGDTVAKYHGCTENGATRYTQYCPT